MPLVKALVTKATCLMAAAAMMTGAITAIRYVADVGKGALPRYTEHFKIVASYDPGNQISPVKFTWYLAKDQNGNAIFSRELQKADTMDISHVIVTHDSATAYSTRSPDFNKMFNAEPDHVFGCMSTPAKYNVTSNHPRRVRKSPDGTSSFMMANLVLKSNAKGDPTHVQHEVDGKNVWLPLLSLSQIPEEEISSAFFICEADPGSKWTEDEDVIAKHILDQEDTLMTDTMVEILQQKSRRSDKQKATEVEDFVHTIINWGVGTTWCGAGTNLDTTACPDPKLKGTFPVKFLGIMGKNYDMKTDCCCRQHDHATEQTLESGYDPVLMKKQSVPIRRMACGADVQIYMCAKGNPHIAAVYSPFGFAALWGCLEISSTVSCKMSCKTGRVKDICTIGPKKMRTRSGIFRYSDNWDPYQIKQSLRSPVFRPAQSGGCSHCGQFNASLLKDTDYVRAPQIEGAIDPSLLRR